MTRLTLTIAAFLCSLSAATAALSPHADFPALGDAGLPALSGNRLPNFDKNAPDQTEGGASHHQSFTITEETDVQLDGHSCKFADVPSTATVVTLDLAADGKTVLKLHFKSKPSGDAGR